MPNVKDVYTADEFEVPVISAESGDSIPKVLEAQKHAQRHMQEVEREEEESIAEEEAKGLPLPQVSVSPRRPQPPRTRRPNHSQGRRYSARTQHQANRTKQNVGRRR